MVRLVLKTKVAQKLLTKTDGFSGLQSSLTSSRLDAPDLQLDCLSSDTEDESPEEDVTVVKISR